MKIVDGGITHIMKVIVLEVKLDVAKMVIDSSKYYIDSYFGPMHYNIRTYYDENGKDITVQNVGTIVMDEHILMILQKEFWLIDIEKKITIPNS